MPFYRQSSSSRSSSSIRSSLDSTRRKLIRSISSYLGIQHEDTFYCQICFESTRTTDSVELTTCGHRFCRDCFVQYLTVKINNAQLHPVCFFEEQQANERTTSPATTTTLVCGRVIHVDDIQAIVSSEMWMKYQRFKLHKENDRARDCPFCNHAHIVAIPDNAESLECMCESCHKTYCFVHSNAHIGRTCAEYEREIAATEKINRAAMDAISKPCPGCNCPVEKNGNMLICWCCAGFGAGKADVPSTGLLVGGCDHMTCQHCKTNFCWLCNAIIDGYVAQHFEWWNRDGCPSLQFHADELPALRNRSCSAWLWIAIVGMPAYSIAFVIALLLWPWRSFLATFVEYFALFMYWCDKVAMYLVVMPILTILFSPLIGFEEYERQATTLKAARYQQMRDAFHDQPARATCKTCEQLVTARPGKCAHSIRFLSNPACDPVVS
ncbi:TPA: hypothetical protein N0F65_011694 [Lagenidium giganteum]|uniref:RBR-type E3 ubiquitin transferase n=1 Tax=Lagenidium giganteum TaxID=4803 RepID=A0AAV2YY53_9STRA|nr:TPA: hypothetical protein N0F65_011694 [Lagenidium giganteum]